MKRRIMLTLISLVMFIIATGFVLTANTYEAELPSTYPACCAERLHEEVDVIDDEEAQERVTDCGCGSWGWCCGRVNCPLCNPPRCICWPPFPGQAACSVRCCNALCGRLW